MAKLLAAGVIQTTDRDEFSYQEMITHLPLCALKVCLIPFCQSKFNVVPFMFSIATLEQPAEKGIKR